MNPRRPWFSVLTVKNTNRPGSRWGRLDAASLGKVVVRPITSEAWLSLAAFVAVWIAATLVIWAWGFRSGTFSLAFAIFASVLVAGSVIASFIRLVIIRMTPRPSSRHEDQSR